MRAQELSTAAILAAIRGGRSWIAGPAAVQLSLQVSAAGRGAGIGGRPENQRSTFVASLDQTVVSAALYRIGESLNGLTAQAWVTTAFLITSTICVPVWGKLSDTHGRKPLFLAAIAVFLAGSALCAFAVSMPMLAACRAFQGIGAGGMLGLTSAVLGDIVPPRERGRYGAYFVSAYAVASVAGPVTGGALAGQRTLLGVDGWRWIFLINLPVGAAACAVIVRVLRQAAARAGARPARHPGSPRPPRPRGRRPAWGWGAAGACYA